MTVDRYTKLVLTVIAVCLLWIAFGGRSMITPVEAQQQDGDNRVILAAWIDANGNVRPFPNPPPPADRFKATAGTLAPSQPLPIWNTNP
jgi:hypothetical protein